MNDIKVLTKNWDIVDPYKIETYQKKGGYRTLWRVLRELAPAQVIEQIKKSGLQGRGGAGFLSGDKWEMAAKNQTPEKYFICNLDESEPGTFKDRLLAEKNPHQLIEGILIASFAVGAKKAYIYINSSFKSATAVLEHAIKEAYKKDFLGRSIMGTVFDLDLELFVGAGAYICGEETALINSIEGKRGEPRMKPPYACDCGLFGKPTVVNNAETLANVLWIMENGVVKYRSFGLRDCPGTKLFCIDGSVKNPGLYEAPIGTSIRELIYEYAGGIQKGKRFWFAQVGGSSGKIATLGLVDEVPSFSKNANIPMGSGAVLVVDRDQDPKQIILSWVNFFQRESCGKCVPCREGTFRLKGMIERLASGDFDQNDREDMEKLIWTLENTTFCPLGKFSVVGLKDVIKYKLVKEL